MTLEVLPVGQKCNLHCTYCYENPMRDAGNAGGEYNVGKLLNVLNNATDSFALFGGEPLLMKFEDLEKLLELGLAKWKHNGIQSNGVLITERHIELFKRTNTHVGISIDGAGKMNTPRCNEKLTWQVHSNLRACVKAGLSVALIITLHRYNASPEKLLAFIEWIKGLDDLGIQSARLHILEGHHDRSIELTEEETINAFLAMARLEMRVLKNLRFDKFQDMLALLKGEGKDTACVYNDCDPYTTAAVQGVAGDGTVHNCGRTNKDGIDWIKSATTSFIRQTVLYNTPYEDGGCKDCRFFLACRGYCPGTAIDQDWRNRTESCRVLMAIFEFLEESLLNTRVIPVSQRVDRKALEEQHLAHLNRGQQQQASYYHEDWVLVNGVRIHKV